MARPTSHGTRNMFAKHGCRCDACVAAAHEYNANYRKRDSYKKYMKKYAQNKAKEFADYKLSLGGCVLCGYNKCAAALDFHHKGDKFLGIGLMKTGSWEKMMEEVDGCILVCANCHREIHWLEEA